MRASTVVHCTRVGTRWTFQTRGLDPHEVRQLVAKNLARGALANSHPLDSPSVPIRPVQVVSQQAVKRMIAVEMPKRPARTSLQLDPATLWIGSIKNFMLAHNRGKI